MSRLEGSDQHFDYGEEKQPDAIHNQYFHRWLQPSAGVKGAPVIDYAYDFRRQNNQSNSGWNHEQGEVLDDIDQGFGRLFMLALFEILGDAGKRGCG